MGLFGGGDERLWIFDPTKNIEDGKAFQPVAYIGSTFLSVAYSNDRVYFIQYKNLDDARNYFPEFVREEKQKDIEFDDDLHLRSVSLDQATDKGVTDHGKIIDKDGRKVSMIESLAVNDKDDVFMNGSWYSLSEDEASHQYIWQGLKDSYTDMCDTFKTARVKEHMVMHHGQFFSYVNVSKDIKK